MVLCVLTGWLDRREREAIAYLIEENRLLRRQLGDGDCVSPTTIAVGWQHGPTAWAVRPCGRSPRSDAGHAATLASTADCAEMDVRPATQPAQRAPRDPPFGRADGGGESDVGLHADPRRAEKPRPPRGPLNDPAHPEGGRSSTRTSAADFMADVLEGPLGRDRGGGLLYHRSLDVARPRHVLHGVRHRFGLAPCRGRGFHATTRTRCSCSRSCALVTAADDGIVVNHRVLICDRDSKWSRAVRRRFGEAGLRVVVTPERAPNANAYAERFVRSINEECLHQLIPLGAWHFRRAVAEYVEHYHPRTESPRTRQPIDRGDAETVGASRVRRRSRLGGLLNYYERAARSEGRPRYGTERVRHGPGIVINRGSVIATPARRNSGPALINARM